MLALNDMNYVIVIARDEVSKQSQLCGKVRLLRSLC